MGKIKAIATYIVVAGFLLIGMSHFAFASSVSMVQSGGANTDFTITFTGFGTGGVITFYSPTYPYNGAYNYANSDPKVISACFGEGWCGSTNNLTGYVYWNVYTDSSLTTLIGSFYAHFTSGLLDGQNYSPVAPLNYTTRFISLTPVTGTTTATTTLVGAEVYANAADFPNYGRVHVTFTHDGTFACINSGVVYDAVVTCAAPGSTAQPFTIDFDAPTDQLINGNYNLSTTTTFAGGGNWTAVYEIQQVSLPWYYLYIKNSYNTLVSTTTHFTIGSLSLMDTAIEAVASSSAAFTSSTGQAISSHLASTTRQLFGDCNPTPLLLYAFSLGITGSSTQFSIGDCVTDFIWPGSTGLADDMTIIKQTPPWGYVFRAIDILSAPISTSTLPAISYSFATSSPMSAVGNIHFDPFGSIAEAGTLVNTFTSDRGDGATVWSIMMPVVNIFVYMVLVFMIIHDLTGIHGREEKDNSKDS